MRTVSSLGFPDIHLLPVDQIVQLNPVYLIGKYPGDLSIATGASRFRDKREPPTARATNDGRLDIVLVFFSQCPGRLVLYECPVANIVHIPRQQVSTLVAIEESTVTKAGVDYLRVIDLNRRAAEWAFVFHGQLAGMSGLPNRTPSWGRLTRCQRVARC